MAKYTNAGHTAIEAEIDGITLSIPVDPANRHYREHILEAGITPAAYEPPPEPVPATITPRQLILGLLGDGHITADQAVAWSSGILPAPVEAVIAALPPADAVAARVSLLTMRAVDRSDALTATVAASQGLTPAEVDDCFRRWAAL